MKLLFNLTLMQHCANYISLDASRWDCYNGLVASMDILPNILCYETGSVKLVLGL